MDPFVNVAALAVPEAAWTYAETHRLDLPPELRVFRDLIAGPAGADRLDWVLRDHGRLGWLPVPFSVDSIAEGIRILDGENGKRIAHTDEAAKHIARLADARSRIYEWMSGNTEARSISDLFRTWVSQNSENSQLREQIMTGSEADLLRRLSPDHGPAAEQLKAAVRANPKSVLRALREAC